MTENGTLSLASKDVDSFTPMYDRVLVELIETENVSAGGIFIPDTIKDKPSKGRIVKTGPGKLLQDGSVRKLRLDVGGTVLFGKYAGMEVKLDDKKYLLLREEEILGKFD